MRHDSKGKDWRHHAAPFLARALHAASKSWHPSGGKPNKAKLISLRSKRASLNAQIKKELGR